MKKIILASKSPRRRQLLEWAEVDFEIMVEDTDETFPPGLTPEEAAIHIAREKSRAVRKKTGGDPIILAADTIVVLGSQIIGKPASREEAIATLTALSGKKHQVITAVHISTNDREITFADQTDVRFHPLTESQITYYVDHYQPYDKAGAYAIQEWIGVIGIHSIQGDFYNVMGLPVSRVVQSLQSFQ